jgi:chromosome partitioning protein
MSAIVVSFINYKGGVGKTTTTYHVGCSLAYHHGKRVLLIDIDPQTNLTFLAVDYPAWQRFKQSHGTIATLYSRFRRKIKLDTNNYIWQSPLGQGRSFRVPNIDLLPCDIDLLGEDLGGAVPVMPLQSGNPFKVLQDQAKNVLREWSFLKQTILDVQDKYDYILIDCPPNIYMMTQNALVASHWYVVTTIPEYLSRLGMEILDRKVKEIGQRVSKMSVLASDPNTGIAKLGGIILVKVRVGGSMLTSQHETGMLDIQRAFPGMCFVDFTTELIGYSEAAEYRLPIWLTPTSAARRGASKLQYENITNEFLRRFP